MLIRAGSVLGSLPTPLNRFRYARNSPLVYTDLSGQWSCGSYSGEVCARTAAWHGWWDVVDPLAGPDAFMLFLRFVPLLETFSDAYFLGKGLWTGFTTGEWDWMAVGIDAAALAAPFAGLGMVRLDKPARSADRIDEVQEGMAGPSRRT